MDVASGAVCAGSNPAGGARRLPGRQAAELAVSPMSDWGQSAWIGHSGLLALPTSALRGRPHPVWPAAVPMFESPRPIRAPEPSSPGGRCRSARARQRIARPCDQQLEPLAVEV